MMLVDAHEDLAYNTLVDGRNYLQSAHEIRAREEGSLVPELNGLCMLGLPEWLEAKVGVIFATLFTMPRGAAKIGDMSYANSEAAYQQALAQYNIYLQWATAHSQITMITHKSHLEAVLESWNRPVKKGRDERQVGLVLLMENAAPIREIDEVGLWYERGVRIIGPAWGTNLYTGSDRNPGPLTSLGRQLLDAMDENKFILDVSHMSDDAAVESLKRYKGPVIASHANPRRLVPSNRMLPDHIIEQIIDRDGIIGVMPANWAVRRDWSEGSGKDSVILADVIEAIEIICQIAGDAHHVGIGSDFDGGFGAESTPAEIDTIADLPRLIDALKDTGFREDYIPRVMGQNWLRLLWQNLPE